jgi:hypothetical protein
MRMPPTLKTNHMVLTLLAISADAVGCCNSISKLPTF